MTFRSVDELVKIVSEQRTIDFQTCFQRVVNSFHGNDEIEELSLHVSLRCPISLLRITIPSRGRDCKHLQCFDLQSYLSLNEKNPKFICPCCHKPLPFFSLVVDEYFHTVLKESKNGIDEAEINPDGKWILTASNKRKQGWDRNEGTKKLALENPSQNSMISSPSPSPIPSTQDFIDLT